MYIKKISNKRIWFVTTKKKIHPVLHPKGGGDRHKSTEGALWTHCYKVGPTWTFTCTLGQAASWEPILCSRNRIPFLVLQDQQK
jgi:hypothetical protein